MSEIKVEERYVGYLFDEFCGNQLKFVVAREISVFIKSAWKSNILASFFLSCFWALKTQNFEKVYKMKAKS